MRDEAVHPGLRINERDRRCSSAMSTPRSTIFKVPSQDKSEVLGFVESLKKDIVE